MPLYITLLFYFILQNISNQHYPPRTQENYKIFSSSNLIMGKGKELEFPEGWGGGKGEPGVPPISNRHVEINNF
jgi:hypothetical protein